MCSRCEDLEEEVEYLKGLLGEQADAARIETLRRNLSLTPQRAKILDRLYGANGMPVAAWTLHEMFSCEDTASGGLNVAMSAVRKAMGDRGSIEVVRGVGYRLSARGLAIVKRALTLPSDSRPPKARRYTDAQIRRMRTLRAGAVEAGERFGCSHSLVHKIRRRTIYADVAD